MAAVDLLHKWKLFH